MIEAKPEHAELFAFMFANTIHAQIKATIAKPAIKLWASVGLSARHFINEIEIFHSLHFSAIVEANWSGGSHD
jgi:hypothetical protein